MFNKIKETIASFALLTGYCSLCNRDSFSFYVTFCWTHRDTPMVVSVHHKPEFSEAEKEMIKEIFKGRHVRFEMQSIKDHAHCHIED